MIGMGVAELILLAMMAGGGLPQQIAFGNPAVWLAQSVVTRSMPMGAAAAWLLLEQRPPPPPIPVAPPPKRPAQPKP